MKYPPMLPVIVLSIITMIIHIDRSRALEQADLEQFASLEPELVKLSLRTKSQVVLIDVYGTKRDESGLRQQLFADTESLSSSSRLVRGAGIVVSDSGIIATHAALLAFRHPLIQVRYGSTTLRGRVFAKSTKTGLAFIQVDPDSLFSGAPYQPPQFRTTPINPGEWVLSYGQPLHTGKDNFPSTNLGRIAGVGPYSSKEFQYSDDWLFLDVAVNPGSYGGPLFDSKGQFIGIIAPLINDSQDQTLLQVAIPASLCQQTIDRAFRQRKPKVGFFAEVNPDTKQLVVTKVRPDSPAARAGIETGDVLVRANNRPIQTLADFARELERAKLENEITVLVRRGKSSRELTIIPEY